METNPSLSSEEIRNTVNCRIEATYKGLNHLEEYAMFMGKVQIFELSLKGFAARKFGINFESMETWTLGRVKNTLKENGLRKDFIAYLEIVVEHRNYIAHELLANNAIMQSVADFSDRKLYGDLYRGIHQLEQIMFLYEWCEENDGWD